MDCPRCGFEQPPDIYCANCGVQMEQHSRRRRRMRLVGAMVGVAALVIGIALFWPRGDNEDADVDTIAVAEDYQATSQAPPARPASSPRKAEAVTPPPVVVPPRETPASSESPPASEPPPESPPAPVHPPPITTVQRIVLEFADLGVTVGEDDAVLPFMYNGEHFTPMHIVTRSADALILKADTSGDYIPDGYYIIGIRYGVEVKVVGIERDEAGYMYILIPAVDAEGRYMEPRVVEELEPGEEETARGIGEIDQAEVRVTELAEE